MSNLQKFNETLEDFEKEVGKLNAVSDAYQKLQELTLTYADITKQFDENSKSLNQISELQKERQKEIEKSLKEIESTNVQNKSELSKLFEEKSDLIRKENKDFYKDMDSTLRIKLDDNKSQIKQLIENERILLKQIIENEISKQTSVILANQKAIKSLVLIFGIITTIISCIILYKLFT